TEQDSSKRSAGTALRRLVHRSGLKEAQMETKQETKPKAQPKPKAAKKPKAEKAVVWSPAEQEVATNVLSIWTSIVELEKVRAATVKANGKVSESLGRAVVYLNRVARFIEKQEAERWTVGLSCQSRSS